MKKLLFIILLTSTICSFGQKNCFVFKHTNYISHFDTLKHYPVLVEYWLTKAHEQCAGKLVRNNTFAPDPILKRQTDLDKDYVLLNKGLTVKFDRGHNMACDDNLCQGETVERECFYFSNMCPQYHTVNNGSWKKLEAICRNMANVADSVHVWTGSIGKIQGSTDRLYVPAMYWKVLYCVSSKQWEAYLFQNNPNDALNQLDKIKVDKKVIEQLTGFTFK
jgi:endonuclease G